jgi:PAS domain S-box-containing protein
MTHIDGEKAISLLAGELEAARAEIAALKAGAGHRPQASARPKGSWIPYEDVFRDTTAPTLVIDRDSGRLVDANAAACGYYGYSHEVLSAMYVWDLDTDGEAESRRRMAALAPARQTELEGEHRLASGEIRNVRVYTGPLHAVGRDLLHAIVLDVTHHKRAEAALRESELRFRSLFEQAGDYMLVLDLTAGGEPRVVDANRAALLAFGYAREELLGRPISLLEVSELGPDSGSHRRRRIVDGHHEITFEVRHRRKDGSCFDAEVRVREVTVAGRVLAVAVERDVTERNREDAALRASQRRLHEDVAERKRAEAALRENEGRYAMLANNILDVVYALDGEGKIVTVNGAIERYGHSEASVKGRPFLEFVNPDDHATLIGSFLKALEERRRVTTGLQFRIVAKSGIDHWFELNARAHFDDHGVYLGEDGVLRDVTDRKRAEDERAKLEAQLHHARKMESVGRLAGGVAHDFNNMLSVILAHTELALETVDPALPLHEDLSEIHGAARRSAELTRQLLAFARKQTVAPKVLDLNQTVTGMSKMLHRLIGENVQLDWLPGERLWQLRIDPSQLDQILANLCVNARDAITDVGTVTIETSNVTFDASDCASRPGFLPGAYVRLVVSDDGCGMDEETLPHVFEPFFTTKPVGEGTGLGLATVYGIVRQNGGFIDVSSELGRGTAFTIYLPRHVGATESVADQAQAGPAECGQETVLLVDDEPAILKATARMLESLGYVVLAAESPGAALRLTRAREGEIHLLLTDVIMPEMNGRDLARSLLSLRPGLRSLFMSGYPADVIAPHGVLDEGVDFLEKPFSRRGLAAKVRAVLDAAPAD